MAKSMQEASTSKLYDLWSKIYDHSFGALVHQRQIRAINELRLKPGERVLDLGVGTGMTLSHYPADVKVVGLDLSAGMLAKAAEKVEENNLHQVRLLVRADAMFPPFADNSFDHILITHTISVVSDPDRLLAWAARMVKPGGRIVILNHFQSTHRPLAMLEKWFNPMFVKIGWRSDLSLSELLRHSPLKVQYLFKMGLWDLWQIVVLSDQPNHDEKKTPQPTAPTSESGDWRPAMNS